MYGYVYKITNKLNGKIYVGKRVSEVFDENYWGSGKIIKNAINKYGINNFDRDILQWYDSDLELNVGEIYWIDKLDSTNHTIGYNITAGGTGGDTFTNNTPENKIETSRKLSEAFTGRIAIHRGNELAYINSEGEFYLYEQDGWELGGKPRDELSKLRASETLKNYIYITNGVENKRIDPTTIDQYPGFVIGFTYNPTEKQLNAFKNRSIKADEKHKEELIKWKSEDHYCETCGKKLVSKYGSGRFCSQSCARSHPHSQETKNHLRELSELGVCGRKGKKNTAEHNKKISLSNKGKKKSFGWRLVNGKREYYKK